MANVLVVDDQPCIRGLISEALTLDGHTVQALGDSHSVRDYLSSNRPDLVLLDLHLEGPEGFGLLRDIKEDYPDLPVIIVTAYDSYRHDARLSAASGYVIKRIGFWDELKEAIGCVLSDKSEEKGNSSDRFCAESLRNERGLPAARPRLQFL